MIYLEVTLLIIVLLGLGIALRGAYLHVGDRQRALEKRKKEKTRDNE